MRKLVLSLMVISFAVGGNWKLNLSIGGFSGNYGDYNSFVSYEKSWLKFNNETWADFQKELGFITNYSSQKGSLKELSLSLPVSLRISRRIKSFDFFIEGFLLKGSAVSKTSYGYNFQFSDGSSSSLTYQYSPFALKASFFGLGLGANKRVFTRSWLKLNVEAGLGFSFVLFNYDNDLTGKMELSGYWIEIKNHLKMDGKGPGFYAYAGVEVPFLSRGKFSLSLKGGYFYSKVFSVKGDSSLNASIEDSTGYNHEESETWSGQWFMKEIDLETWWGSVKYRFPSNYQGDLGGFIKDAGKFSPTIHGPYLSFSIGYRF